MAERTDNTINQPKDLHTPTFMKVVDALIGDNYQYIVDATFDFEPEDSHKKVQVSIKTIPMDSQTAQVAVSNIQDALFRDANLNSTVTGKGKTLDVPLPSSGKKPQVIRIAVRQPSIKGSGGGSEVTRIGESAQCYYLALRFYHPDHSLKDLTCGCDTILQKKDFEWAQKYVNTNATVDEVSTISLDWRESCCHGANAVWHKLNGGTGHNYKFVRGNNPQDIDDGAVRGAFNKVKKLPVSNGGTNFSSEDKWNPADIWLLDTGKEIDIRKELDPSVITTIGALNSVIYKWFKSQDLIGISLKKNPNKPTLTPKNIPGVARTTEATWVKSEVVFDNQKKFTGTNVSKRYPMDVYIYYGTGSNDRFQARNFGGSSTSPTNSWQLELKGKFANQGRIGGGVVYGIIERLGLRPGNGLGYNNKKTWDDAKGDDLVDEIYKRLIANSAKGINGLKEPEVKAKIMEQDQSYRYSKVSGLRLIDFLKKSGVDQDKVVKSLYYYASSESDDSGVYYKMQ